MRTIVVVLAHTMGLIVASQTHVLAVEIDMNGGYDWRAVLVVAAAEEDKLRNAYLAWVSRPLFQNAIIRSRRVPMTLIRPYCDIELIQSHTEIFGKVD